MRALFTSQAGSGHWRPLLPLAMALAAAGHEVAVATTPVACASIAVYGLRCFPVGIDDWRAEAGTPPDLPGPTAPAAEVWVEVFAKVRAAHALPDLLTVCATWQPDLLVRELTEFAGGLAAERLDLPHAVVQVGAWRPDLLAHVTPALDRLRATVDLPPASAPLRVGDLLLTLSPPSFLASHQPLPAPARSLRYVPFDVGPEGAEAGPTWSDKLGSRPTVAATFGTVNHRTPGLAATILAAFRDEPVNLVLTAGPDADPAAFGPQPPYVWIERYVPLSRLLPACDVVVCHGGFSTVLTALQAGLPLVLLPVAADQPDTARRCAELGAGAVLGPGERTPEAIRAAVRTVLADPRYRQRAQRLRAELRAAPDLADAVRLLEQLARERQLLTPGR